MIQANEKRECSFVGCTEVCYNSFSMSPGTYVNLCQTHYVEEMKEKGTIVVTSKEYLELLKDWNGWVKTYYSLMGPRPELVGLINKTVDIIARGEME